uniref:Alpha-1,6-mannosyl-glycoprotein 2-beta-N-acetylglucosaminyltransferase n=1 Tax=Ditylenchus dipsaci TaxID=166011 RepID=A0A915DWP9_9BILA
MIFSKRKLRSNFKLVLLFPLTVVSLFVLRSVLRPSYATPDSKINLSRINLPIIREDNPEYEMRQPLEANKIIESIRFLNDHHEVLNEDKFGPLNNKSVNSVIVIQVHSRIEYLKYLISSLEKVKEIEGSLLVFSHDLNVNEINKLIRSIKFCRAIQIFYPHNIQIFPNTFPGRHPNDCPEKATKEEAADLKCLNWKYPDKYGHYRIPSLTQIKHHWWWKMNYVFDGVVSRYGLESHVVLLEEDHVVTPDFCTSFIVCADCQVICLGTYLKTYKNYKADLDKLSLQIWYSSKHNMGMAINAELWNQLRNCSEMFCTYDDYNWDWSLLQLSVKCLPAAKLKSMRVIQAKAPRVLHIGDCGVHTHRCAVHSAASTAMNLLKAHDAFFFPPDLHLADISKRMLKPSKPNGGWGDIRDHKLCLLNTYPLKSMNKSSSLSVHNAALNFDDFLDI